MSEGLDALRAKIDAVDDLLLTTLAERARLVDEVAALKRTEGLLLRDPAREQAIVDRASRRAPSRLPAEAVGQVFRAILAACYPSGGPPGGAG